MNRKARKRLPPPENSSVSGVAVLEVPVGYARVEAALAKAYGVEHVQKAAFRGRLKHFRKLGIPVHVPGKGARIQYGEEDIWQLMVCCELSEFGLDPNQIVKIVRRHWEVSRYFPDAIRLADQLPGNDFFVAIPVNFMSRALVGEIHKETEASISFHSGDPVGGVRFFKATDHQQFLSVMSEPGYRACVFNLSARVRAVKSALEGVS